MLGCPGTAGHCRATADTDTDSFPAPPFPQLPPVPYGPSQERIEGVEPVVHVLVTACLQQDAPMFRAHRKCVWGLLGESQG